MTENDISNLTEALKLLKYLKFLQNDVSIKLYTCTKILFIYCLFIFQTYLPENVKSQIDKSSGKQNKVPENQIIALVSKILYTLAYTRLSNIRIMYLYLPYRLLNSEKDPVFGLMNGS